MRGKSIYTLIIVAEKMYGLKLLERVGFLKVVTKRGTLYIFKYWDSEV